MWITADVPQCEPGIGWLVDLIKTGCTVMLISPDLNNYLQVGPDGGEKSGLRYNPQGPRMVSGDNQLHWKKWFQVLQVGLFQFSSDECWVPSYPQTAQYKHRKATCNNDHPPTFGELEKVPLHRHAWQSRHLLYGWPWMDPEEKQQWEQKYLNGELMIFHTRWRLEK